MKRQRYLIVLKQTVNIERFEHSDFVRGNQDLYLKLRQSFSRFDHKRYRGISREPLDGYLSADEGKPDGVKVNRDARSRLSEIVSQTTPEYYDDCFIETIEDAESIYKMLDDQINWEIIGIRRDTFLNNPGTLGFDVGYWGGDHFSLIADTIVTPQWHPPDFEDSAELASQLSGLNEHLLFPTASAAAEFKAYYKSKSWAETEDKEGEFCIVQVNAGRWVA